MYSPCHFENRRNYAGARRAAQLALSVLLCILALAFAKDAEASMAPVITSATTASGVVGTAFSYQITATNTPTGYGATGLPNGLSVNTTSGLISGTPSGAGVSTVALSATNSGGTGTATLTLTILGGGAGPL
ncbi:MAG: Ig domain-containing protein, partial [Terriglobia bacterium]